MKALIQRVSRAGVAIEGRPGRSIGRGYVVLVGVTHGDTEREAVHLARKTVALRVFPDAQGRMNLSIGDVGGEVLVISQFTLYADTRKGNRPSFVAAAPPQAAERLYETYVAAVRRELGAERVATGQFGASMAVELVNDGPVTIELRADGPAPDDTPAAGAQTGEAGADGSAPAARAPRPEQDSTSFPAPGVLPSR